MGDKTVDIRVDLPEVLVGWIDGYVQQEGLVSRSEAIKFAIAEFAALVETSDALVKQQAAETQEERDEIFHAALERRAAIYRYQRHY